VKIWIPNAVTLMGAFAALLSMLWAPTHPYWACNALIAASLFDMVDGRIARLLGAQSAIGQQLDSLVDLVAFGVAPAYLLFAVSFHKMPLVAHVPLGLLPTFAFVASSAIRLALFNIRAGDDPRSFQGIPTPVSALLVVTAVMSAHELSSAFFAQTWFLCSLVLVCSVLMILPIPFPSFKSFRTRLGMILYFGSMGGGLTMLFVGLPGGTVLFGFVSFYVLRGLAEAGWRRMVGPASEPKLTKNLVD
jgi:CDP-diacylglycerol--serine O-phosphatidyltransferase